MIKGEYVLGAALASLLGHVSVAQNGEDGGWLVEVVGGPVSPANPSVTVRVAAYFPSWCYAAAQAKFDLRCDDVIGTWDMIHVPPPLSRNFTPPYGCVGWRSGEVLPGVVREVAYIQLGIMGCIPLQDNPLPVWEGRWTTASFEPRTVSFQTANTPWFYVYSDSEPRWLELVAPNRFRHGSAEIEVVPGECWADCDTSTGQRVLDIFDFLCFQNRYAAGTPYACDCNTATGPGLCDIFDFLCFQNAFAGGCP